VADRPLRPAKDHRLGKLLPYQQPNPAQAHLKAVVNLFQYSVFFILKLKKILKELFQTLGQILMHYSPVRHVIDIRLACVKYIASVHPEPGSNSLQLQLLIKK
jgi:hypothetical protein